MPINPPFYCFIAILLVYDLLFICSCDVPYVLCSGNTNVHFVMPVKYTELRESERERQKERERERGRERVRKNMSE